MTIQRAKQLKIPQIFYYLTYYPTDCERLPIAAHKLTVMPATIRMPRRSRVLGSVLKCWMKITVANVMIMPQKTVQSPLKKSKTSHKMRIGIGYFCGSDSFIFRFSLRRLTQRIRLRLSSR